MYGHNIDLFSKWGGSNLKRDFASSHFEIDKYTNVYYRIVRRSKNKKNPFTKIHSEHLELVFDSNLSSDFTITELNIATGESFTISLLSSKQGDYGPTQLKYLVQYVDKEQNLHQIYDLTSCETIKGTISTRLKLYRKRLLELKEKYYQDYLDNGIKTHLHDKILSLAAHIHVKDRAKMRTPNFSHYDDNINKILILFSILSDDCFYFFLDKKPGFDLQNRPYAHYNKYEDLVKTSLEPDDHDLLEALYEFYRNNKKLVDGFFEQAEIKIWSGNVHDYMKLKELVKAKLAIEEA